MLHSCYIRFIHSLHYSKKVHVKALFSVCKNDLRTVTGQNIYILIEKYSAKTVKDLFVMKIDIAHKPVRPIEDKDRWRENFLEDLVSMRKNTNFDF